MEIHCYVDTGASLSLASRYIIPEEHLETSPRVIKASVANGDHITINKVVRNIDMQIQITYFISQQFTNRNQV